MHLHIATPMYGGNCKGVYVDGLMALTFELARKGYQVSFSKIYNESLITRARNNLVYEFEKSGADALLFIDADEGFNHMDVIKMIESGKDVIGAIYPMKNINWENVRKAAIIYQSFPYKIDSGFLYSLLAYIGINLVLTSVILPLAIHSCISSRVAAKTSKNSPWSKQRSPGVKFLAK